MKKPEIEIFIDTSILIYRFLRAETKRNQVEHQLSGKKVITCAIVLHEYKRRVLREAEYLITLLNEKGSLSEVRDHLSNLNKKQERKRKICLYILDNIIGALPPEEQNERAITMLHTFIVRGMRRAQRMIDQEYDAIECACARLNPRVVKPYRKYDFGPDKCSKERGECGISIYMIANKETIIGLLDFLAQRRGEFTKEMEAVYQFLEGTKDNYDFAPDFNPCLTLGDLLIALESKEVKLFYTGNYKESRFFCEFFRQNLIVASHNPDHEDQLYPISDLPWNFS